jgi:hypothetical protein
MMMRAYSTVEATRCDPATTDLLSGQTVGTADSRHPHDAASRFTGRAAGSRRRFALSEAEPPWGIEPQTYALRVAIGKATDRAAPRLTSYRSLSWTTEHMF